MARIYPLNSSSRRPSRAVWTLGVLSTSLFRSTRQLFDQRPLSYCSRASSGVWPTVSRMLLILTQWIVRLSGLSTIRTTGLRARQAALHVGNAQPPPDSATSQWARHWTSALLLSTRLLSMPAILHLSATPIEWCTLRDMFPILARYGAHFLLSKSQGRCQLPEEAQVTAFGYFSPGLLSPSRLVDRGSCGLQSRRLSCGRPRGIFCLVFSAPRGDLRRAPGFCRAHKFPFGK